MTLHGRSESVARGPEMNDRLILNLRWRVGRKVGNTIYVIGGERPFALMPTPAIAAHVVGLHNATLEADDA